MNADRHTAGGERESENKRVRKRISWSAEHLESEGGKADQALGSERREFNRDLVKLLPQAGNTGLEREGGGNADGKRGGGTKRELGERHTESREEDQQGKTTRLGASP